MHDGLHDTVVEARVDEAGLVAEHRHRDSLLRHQEGLGRIHLELAGHAGPDAHDAQGRDHFALLACRVAMRIRKIDYQVEPQAIGLVEARLGEVLGGGGKHDRDARELLF